MITETDIDPSDADEAYCHHRGEAVAIVYDIPQSVAEAQVHATLAVAAALMHFAKSFNGWKELEQ